MDSPSQNKILISLIAALALSVPIANLRQGSDQQKVPEQQPSPATEKAPSNPPKSGTSQVLPNQERQGAAKLLCDFFGSKNPNLKKSRNQGDYCDIKKIIPKEYEVTHLIATVPDPIDSRLDYFFDRNLNAIQRGIEETGYIFDRHCLPWERSKGLQQHTDNSINQKQSDPSREPGIILFRNIRNGEHKLFLLFLIGETPTTGIHKDAFGNALYQIMKLHEVGVAQLTDEGDLEIRVLGPTFSGSAISLAFSIRSGFELFRGSKRLPRPRFQVISGSALAVNKLDFLCLIDNSPNVTFNSTIPLDSDVRRAFFNYLKSLKEFDFHNSSPQIAILTEGNTTYGRSVNPEHYRKSAVQPSCLIDEDKPPPPPRLPIMWLPFPLHISQLRSEVSKIKPSKNDLNNVLSPSHSTTLPMGEGGEPKSRDVIPLFSPLETASTELVLRNILSAIHHEPIRYIGVVATDVQDRIFLVRELRKHCPNAVIFILSADLLYLHSGANLDFQGVLVITPYPLFNLNQFWSYPFRGDRNRLQSPSQSAQGTYNALLALMNFPERMIEYGRPFDTGISPRQNSEPHFHKPVFWLSIVGHNGIWPVKILGPDKIDKISKDQLRDSTESEKAQRDVALKSYTYPVLPKLPGINIDANTKITIQVGDRDHSSLITNLLLFLSLFCLFPPAVLLLQMIRKWLNMKKRKGWIKRIREWLNSCQLLNRNLIGRIFSVDNKYKYGFDRHVYLFSCCVSLLVISLGCIVVTLLPGWIDVGKESVWGHGFWFKLSAYIVLSLTLIILLTVLIWLLFSILYRVWQRNAGRWSRLLTAFSLFISLGLLALACFALGEIVKRASGDETAVEALFLFLRATDFRSGVSILAPWIFVGLAFFLSVFSALRRLDLAERMYSLEDLSEGSLSFGPYLNFTEPSFAGLKALEDKVKEYVIGRIFTFPGVFLIFVITLVPYLNRFWVHQIPSIEGWGIDWFFKVAFYIIPLLLGLAFLRFFWLSLALRRLLRLLGWHPLFSAPVETKDKSFQMLPKVNLMSPTPTYSAMSASIAHAKEFFRLLNNRTKIVGVLGWTNPIQKNIWIEKAERLLQMAIKAESERRWRYAIKPRRATQQAISSASKEIACWMEPHWNELIDESAKDKELIRQGRIFMISHVAAFLQYILVHLQNLAGLVTIGLLLVLMAATSYPFQPREPLLLFSWVSILIAAAVTLFTFVQLNRDKVLSLLSGTTPGAINLSGDLVYRVLIHGVVPIIALLGAQFPEVVRNLLSWLNIFQGKGI